MKKYKSFIWITSFLIIIASPVFSYFFLEQYVDSKNYENRDKISKPILTIENYESFPEEYEAYYNDNIPFRNQLIKFNNSIDYFLFKQSSSHRVAIGKEGWLFYCDDTDGNPIEQSLGYWDFTANQLKTIANNLMSTKHVLESFGIEFVLFIAPNKETIYMDKLPDYYKVKNHYTSTDQLINYLMENTDIRIVYPKQDLLNTRKENSEIFLYHKLDTHWNYAGSYIGTKSLAEELGIEMPSLNEIFLEPKLSSSGDLTKMLNITIKDADMDYNLSGITSLNTSNEKWDLDTEFIYHTDGANSRKLFVRRDSFSIALAPSLATQFENSIWVHKKNFNQQQIFDYGANIFVFEVVERKIKELENFKISFLSYSIEHVENKTKRIVILPAITKSDLQYISVFKKNNEIKNSQTVQLLNPFNESIVLDIPDDEKGEINIYIFADKTGNKMLEEVTINY